MIAAWKDIKYLPPDLKMLENVYPAKDIKGFFRDQMGFDHMKENVMMAWEMIEENAAKEEELGSGEGWQGVIS